MGYTKDREEKDIYEMSFKNRVAVGETISTPEVRVSFAQVDGWVDATSELLGVVVVVASTVQFTLKNAATAVAQPVGRYRVFVKVNTSQGRIIVGKADLEIEE